MSKSIFRLFGFIIGIILAGAAAGACIGFFTNSWSIFSPESPKANPLYFALTLGFAVSSGLAVYSFFGWFQSRRLRSEQEAGFKSIKDLIEQERKSFMALTRIWEHKELAWQGEKNKWNNERETWCQQREKWEIQKNNILKELGKKQQELSMWSEKEKLWDEEKNRFKELKELWQQAQKTLEDEKKEWLKNKDKNSSKTTEVDDKWHRLEMENKGLKKEVEDLKNGSERINEEYEASLIKSEEAIKQLSAQLKEASESRLTFLSKISGSLRTPAERITQLTRSSKKDSKELLGEINRLAATFLTKLENVLDLARLETGSYNLVVSETNLEKVLSRIASDFQPAALARDIDLVWDQAGEDIGKISVDERLIERCIRSLLDNAVKFTERAGRVELKGKIVQEGGRPQAVIEIKDTGIGIAPNNHGKIFEPFIHDIQQRNQISEEGAGLGLSLVKGFLNIHGGDIILKSNVGEGSIFTLTFYERDTESVRKKESEITYSK